MKNIKIESVKLVSGDSSMFVTPDWDFISLCLVNDPNIMVFACVIDENFNVLQENCLYNGLLENPVA